MIFSSITFLFYFIPAVLVMYYLVPARFQNAILFGASLIFYAWGEPIYISMMILSSLIDYTHGLLVDRYRGTWKSKAAVASSVILNLGLLSVFKYSGLFPLPIGISFYTFQTMSYTIDVYRGEVKVQKNILNFGTYVTMFPQLIAGPIVRYVEVEPELDYRNRRLDWDGAARGLWRFGLGLAKKVLLANTMGELWAILSGPAGPGSVAGAWLGLVAYGLQIYFDFSGYSDMAIGLGRMFGYSYPENFNYPYLAQSVTEFWRRWHMTLSRWFRDYLYIPLGGNRVSPARWYVNLMIVWGATGLWHGASWNFLAWGLFFGVMLMLEKMFLLRWTERLPRVLRHTYALFLVLIGWALFAMADMGDASGYFAALVGKTVPFIASETRYYLSSYLGILVLCVIGATELPKRLAAKIFGGEKMQKSVTPYVALVLLIVLFVLSLASLVNGSYNPFLYFRF